MRDQKVANLRNFGRQAFQHLERLEYLVYLVGPCLLADIANFRIEDITVLCYKGVEFLPGRAGSCFGRRWILGRERNDNKQEKKSEGNECFVCERHFRVCAHWGPCRNLI